MNVNINKETYTISINIKDLIVKESGILFDDKFIYIFEKEPFIEYSNKDIETLEFCNKIKHKIRYFLNNV